MGAFPRFCHSALVSRFAQYWVLSPLRWSLLISGRRWTSESIIEASVTYWSNSFHNTSQGRSSFKLPARACGPARPALLDWPRGHRDSPGAHSQPEPKLELLIHLIQSQHPPALGTPTTYMWSRSAMQFKAELKPCYSKLSREYCWGLEVIQNNNHSKRL